MSTRSSFHVANVLRAAVVLTLFAGWCFAQAPAPVKVEGGLVQGTNENGLTVYRGIPFNAQAVEQDHQISEAMSTYCTNFAKYGDPNGQGLPQWPAFSDANPVVMHFAETPHAGSVPSADSLKVLDAYFAWRRTPEGAAAVK